MSNVDIDKLYTQAARSLASRLHAYAKDRKEDDKKAIASLHTELYNIYSLEKQSPKEKVP